MPVDAWKHVMAAYYPGGGWVRLDTATLDALAARKAADGHHSFDALVAELLAMSRLDELVDTLLWEGHQLYPYTPSATKNATPTPFGIVYPAAYAAGSPHTFDRLKLQCIATGTAEFSATVHFLQGAEAQRVELLEDGRRRVRLRAGARAGVDDDRGLRRAGPGDRGRGEHDRGRRRPDPDRGAGLLAAVDARRRALRDGRAVHVTRSRRPRTPRRRS